MLMKLFDYKRAIASAMVFAFAMYNTSLAVVATEINQAGVPFKTATTINQNGNIFNIQTNTTNGAGNIGINTFGRFNVSQGDIVNMNLINAQNKLVNLIFDSSASQINGVVNSYMNGQIGGNVLFANPNGFVVGKTGVFNVGSLTLMTPKESLMKKIFDSSSVNNNNLDKLITFKFGGDNYFIGTTDDGTKQLEMVPAKITIDGKINSAGGIDLINGGRDITIGKDAELNANMSFTANSDGTNVVASVGPSPAYSSTFTTAMNGGKGINILSQNRSDNSDYLSAIVNINGKVHANGGNVIAQTEIYSVDKESADGVKEDVTTSLINVKEKADIQGHDVTLRALAKATKADSDLFGLDETILNYFGITNIVEFLTEQIVHLGKLQTKVTVEDGAKIASTNNTNILAKSELPFNSTAFLKTSPTLALNISVLDVLNEARVKSGANITAGNSLVVQAITDMNYNSGATSTNVLESSIIGVIPYVKEIQKVFGKNGSYALSWVDVDAVNRAIIENSANLSIANDINVLASMVRDITVVTKNGFLPLVDMNQGVLGLALAVADVESTNEAIMNANANINGSLVVNADYAGKLTQGVSGSSGSPGEDGNFGVGGKIVKGIFKFLTEGYAFEKWGNLIDKGFDKIGGNSKDRMNATFGKIQIAGGLNVAIDEAKNHAYIGDASKGEKPVITAKNVVVGSTLTDHKSHVSSIAGVKNAEKSVAGAIAINVKELDSDAKAYGDFTLSGDSTAGAMIVRAKTNVERPSALDSLWNWFDFLDIKHYEKSEDKSVKDVNSTNVDDYLDKFGISDELQEKIDENTSFMSLFKIFDYLTPELGMENFFQTSVVSTASAKSREGDTTAWSGALGATSYTTKANAELVGGSVVDLIGSNPANNKILISADTDSTVWVASSLMSIFNIADIVKGSFAPGSSARDGSAAGGSISILVNNADTNAKIGENAVIKAIDDATHDGVVGDVSVLANENGQFINLSAGSSAADKSGIAGTLAFSVSSGSGTKASIEQGANVSGKDVKVEAKKDDNWYSTLFLFSNSTKSVSFGLSSLFIFDTVEAYINGNVTATGDVIANAIYDKTFLNVSGSIGIAKKPNYDDGNGELIDLDLINEPGDGDGNEGGLANALIDYLAAHADEDIDLDATFNLGGQAEDVANQVRNIGNGHVGVRDKQTYAYAGAVLLNAVQDSVKAYIGDGAKVKAGKDVKVSANSIDQNTEVGAIFSFNGNKGGGATIGFNLNENQVESYIGNATVDAKKDTEVTAGEDSVLYSFSAGIGQAKDSSGVGTLSLDIQKNDISSSIREGAKINASAGYNAADQSIKVASNFDNYLVKGVGAVSIAGTDSAKGAAVDTDAAKTKVTSYIKGADINASKDIEVSSDAYTKLFDITAAGAVSRHDSAYSGSVGMYVADGDVLAYMDNVKVNKTRINNNITEFNNNPNNAGAEITDDDKYRNTTANVKVSAEDTYDNITATGNVSVGKGNTAGVAMRIDVISDNVRSYINNSDIHTSGDLSITNNTVINAIDVAAAGVGSLENSAFGGAIALIVNDMDQSSYIENSSVVSKSVKIDSDTEFDIIDVTGGVTAATQGKAIGGALYVAVADNDINTYIKNSNVTATNNIDLTTNNTIDSVGVILSGSGGQGIAASGAISVIVNNSDSNTYIQSESTSDKKNITSTNGYVRVKGVDDIDITNVTGNVSISTNDVAAGASVNTIVDNSNLNSKVEGVVLSSQKGNILGTNNEVLDSDVGVEVDAYAENDIVGVTIGGAGASGAALQGSINTIVMAGDVTSKIVDSIVTTKGKTKVDAYDKAFIGGGTGAVAISVSAGAIGASIVTGVINNEVVAAIENSKVNSDGKVTVSSLANESIGTESVPFITVAGGGGATVSLDGVIDTMVINSTSDAHIRGSNTSTEKVNNQDAEVTYSVKSTDDVEVKSDGNVVLFSTGGAAAGGGTGGIGATIHTVVIDKDTLSQSDNAIIDAKNIKSSATETDDFRTYLAAAAGGGTLGGAGLVNTNVITSDVHTGFLNSTLTATENIDVISKATANMQTVSGAVAGGGSAGVGLSAVNDIIRYRASAYLDNATATFKELKTDAKTDNIYKFSTVSGAGGGTVGGAGVENVNYINNEVIAYATGNLTGNKATVNAKDKVTFKDSYSGVLAGGGTAGIGATVEVNEVTSTILAYIGGNNVKVDNIDVKAIGEQTFDRIVVAGFAGGGTVAGAGTALANVIETTVKAYVTDGTKIGAEGDNTSKVSLEAKNTIDLTEDIGAIAFGIAGGGVGATVAVNKVKNTVEAYTGKNSTIYSKDLTVNAQSENNLGNADTAGSMLAIAGAGGLYFGGAGTVMYNSVEDTVNAYVGKNNHIYLADWGKLDVKAKDITKIYDGTGAIAGGAGGLGASVDYNVIKNTVVACVKPDSEIIGNQVDIAVVADSQETLNNVAYVVAGGLGALSGAVLYSSIGKKVENASYNNFSANEDKENFQKGEEQAQEVLNTSTEKTQGANAHYNEYYNKALSGLADNKDAKGSKVGMAYQNAKDIEARNKEEKAKAEANPNYEYIPIEITDSKAQKLQPKKDTDSLYTKSAHSGVTEVDTDRTGTTSAFIDSNVKINARNLTVNAKNSDNVKLATNGVAVGAVGVGVSIAVSDNETTTNAFIQNDANIDVNSLTLKAESTDKQHVETLAATGGIVGGSGSSAHINSNKTTNAYINKKSTINALKDILISAISKSPKDELKAVARAHAYGGVGVGASIAHATSEGNTKIDIGEDVSLNSTSGDITIKTDTDENAYSDAWAATGSLVGGGTGAESFATTGKDTTVNIAKNFSATANGGKLEILSKAKNNAYADSSGRAYGSGISAGGTNTRAIINQTSGVKIADADAAKTISAKEVDFSSTADNYAKAKTIAGAGACFGMAGSGVYTNITSNNNSFIGKNYDINTGNYESLTETISEYVGYNESTAFGAAAFAIPYIENKIDSTVKNESLANINSDTLITLKASNEVKKSGANGYDIYGGSGGLTTGSGGYIKDDVKLTTETKLGGDRISAMGDYGEGAIDISAYNIANIDEKADLYSHGGIAGADMDSIVNLKATADVNVSNKKITTKDDHITYAARNDVDIYTKSNVESYGGVAGAGGEASAIASQIAAAVTFEKGAHSTSGRDTNISAVSNKKLVSSIYTRTRGLVSALNDEANAKSQDSKANVNINGNGDGKETADNAVITAFDAINITAQNTASEIKADRDSKAYQLWCIPYTGKGNKNTENTVSGGIVLNGILKSGLGYNKSLHINRNGDQVDKDGNVVENGTYGIYANQKEIGTVKTSDMQEDVQAYEKSKVSVEKAFEDYQRETNEEIGNYSDIVTSNTERKTALENDNAILNNKISDADTDKETESTLLTNLTMANNNLSKLDGSASDIQEYENAYGSLGDEYINEMINTIKAYHAADSEHQAEKYSDYITAKTNWNSHYTEKSAQLSDNIQELEAKIDGWNREILQNNGEIADCQAAIDENGQKITDANNDLQAKEAQKNIDIAKLDAKIAELNAKITTGEPIKVYAIDVGDVVIRSGKITFNGDSANTTHVSGNGYIYAPGENASINIINDSVSNIVFNKLIINSNLKGGVTANNATIDGTIHYAAPNDQPSVISIVNTVDATDPTIDFESNAGDMLFKGDVENPLGNVDIMNSTGDVVVNAGLTAGNLNISVPNGGFEKPYSKDVLQVTGNGIVAGGDISISSLVIDVNGVIKSGTEIKEVTIPEFTIKKVGDNYYQVIGGTEELLTKSSTAKDHYYLKLFDEKNNLELLKGIKAYFKPDDPNATGDNIAGDVILFKANTVGGNVTLTGNIINTNTDGGAKIELMNGFGHINVVNNSVHNLVTSNLNADAETRGVLTINDFIVGTAGSKPEYLDFEFLTQLSAIPQSFLEEFAGTYTIKVGDDGVMVAEAKNQTGGNGYWGSQNATTTLANGAKLYSTTYTPGNDAYYVKNSGKEITQRVYVKRSWIVELFDGKKYVDCSYVTAPEYGVANNPIAVNFVGYDSPEINVKSKGDVILNSSISAIPGTIDIKSDGNIISNSMSNLLSGRHVYLDTNLIDGKIGEYDSALKTVKPIQVAIYGNGSSLSAKGKDIYLNYPKTDVSDMSIFSNNGNVYLGSDSGSLDMKGKHLMGITGANNLELSADRINLNPAELAEGGSSNIVANNWIARAKDDIYIENSGDIVAKYIVSKSGKVSLISKNGSILAGETGTYSTSNIHAGNIVLNALNGAIGAADNALKFANSAVYNVVAKDDVYIDSKSKMYIDRVTSNDGSVNLNSKFGIIASKITTDKLGKEFTYKYDETAEEDVPVYLDGTAVAANNRRVYNISSKKDINLATIAGNIENITVDTDGVINAVAGYNDPVNVSGVADAVSDINITLLSKDLPTTNEGTEIEDYLDGRKNMNVGRIFATQNVTLSSEGAVLKADNSDGIILGDNITINAVGNVGQEADNKGLFFGTNGEVSIYTKAGSDVYIDNIGHLKIRRIDVTNNIVSNNETVTYASNTANSLNKVKIVSVGDITNAVDDKEIKDTISKTTIKGDKDDKEIITTEEVEVNTKSIENVEQTTPNIRAAQIDIKSFGKIGDYSKDLVVETTAQPGLEYMAGAFGSENAYIRSIGDTLYVNSGSSSNTRISTKDTNIFAKDINSNNIIISSETGNIIAKNIVANTAGDNVVTVKTGGNAELTNATADKIVINAVDAKVNGNIATDSLSITANSHGTVSAVVDYLNNDADKSSDLVSVFSYGDVTLKDANINGDTSVIARYSEDVSSDEIKNDINIENTTISGRLYSDADNDTNIKTLTILGENNYLGSTSKGNFNVTDKLDVSGDAIITTFHDTKIKDGTIGGNLSNISENTQITGKLDVAKDANIIAKDNVTVSGEINSDKDVNITALNDVKVSDANIKGNLGITTKTLDIDEMKLDGNINAVVDKADINTSNDLNVDVIKGNTNTYTNNLSIVAENIKNGTGTNNNNIYAKDIDLTANDSIGTRSTSLNVNLPKDNTIAVEAGQLANINTTGSKPNYTKFNAKDAIISSDAGIVIRNLEVDNLDLKTKSKDIDFEGKVNKRGNFRTADKRVSINNENLEPDFYATAQLHTSKNPFKMIINASKNIKVRSKYVVRHNQGILINGTDFLSSMESEAIKSAELSLKNSKRKKGLIEKVDEEMYEIPTVSDYINRIVNSDSVSTITDINGKLIDNSNIMEVINTIGENPSPINTKRKAKIKNLNLLGYASLRREKL